MQVDSSQRESHRPSSILTLLLILFGGFLGGIGWIIGIWRLWNEPGWTARQKVLATAVVPGGLLPGFLFASIQAGTSTCSTGLVSPRHVGPVVVHCTNAGILSPSLMLPLAVLAVLCPVVVAVYLYTHIEHDTGGLVRSQ